VQLIQPEKLEPGHIVVVRGISSEEGFKMVSHIDDDFISLEPLGYLIEEDEQNLNISKKEIKNILRIPIFEKGDPLFYHGKEGFIVEAFPHDLHIRFTLQGEDKIYYSNIIHIDLRSSIRQSMERENL